MLAEYIFIILFFAIPLGVLIWFLISLVRYRIRDPENSEQCRARKLSLILSSIILGVFVLSFVVLMLLIMLSIAHM